MDHGGDVTRFLQKDGGAKERSRYPSISYLGIIVLSDCHASIILVFQSSQMYMMEARINGLHRVIVAYKTDQCKKFSMSLGLIQ